MSTHARLAWLHLHGHLVGGPYPVSLGDRRHPTPTGVFHVARKDREHASSTYGTDMPYAVFFAAGGVAFHAGALDEPSHGCVHLARGPAAAFFAVLEPGNRVEVR